MKLALFEQFIEEFTYVDEELNPEERQQILQARLTNGSYQMIYCRSSFFFLIALFFSEIGMQKGQIHVKFRRFLKLRNLTRILKAYNVQ